MYRIGCDVGGSNTDAAVLDTSKLQESSRGVLATCKTSTTANVTDGIKTAIETVLQKSQIPRNEVINVAIGTTHFVNAVVENDARHLRKVAVIRLCGPHTRRNPPFSDYPYALRDVAEGPVYYLDGGFEVDGREISQLDESQIFQAAEDISKQGIQSVAVVGVFSALDRDGQHEQRCKEIIVQRYPDLSVVCSASIDGPGFLVRENATILNAAILNFAKKTVRRFFQAIRALHLGCPLYLTQNDGTLINAADAAELPVKTFASGPTNSLMGVAFLQGLHSRPNTNNGQVLVVDVGGTTTDVCALMPSGFPRKAPKFVEVGGIRTAFSMPEVVSVGLGGGSRIRSQEKGQVVVGPDSVAYRLTLDALVFGGQKVTATDVAVASGMVSIGDPALVAHLPADIIMSAKSEIKRAIESVIDKMKVSSDPVTVILVGGGSIIVDGKLNGVLECQRPPHHDSANAIGAAVAGIAGEVDTVAVLAGRNEDEVLEQIKGQAISLTIQQGANIETVRIAEITKLPLQYVSDKTTRFIIKAVGDLKSSSRIEYPSTSEYDDPSETTGLAIPALMELTAVSPRLGSMANPVSCTNLRLYKPEVRDRIWYISAIDVQLIALGCGILGTGGGRSSYDMALSVYDVLQSDREGTIRVIPPDSLADSDMCVFGAGYGAPSVSNERISSGKEVFDAVEELNKLCGITEFAAIVANEIGGGNGLVTFPTSARFDRPVVDCDLMGRAYPTIEHVTTCVYGHPITPCAMADSAGNITVVSKASSNTMTERMLRTQCTALGNSTAVASQPLPGSVIKQYAVPNTVSQAWFLGKAVYLARQTKANLVDAIGAVMPVKLLYTGKIIDVKRDLSRGYTVGECRIAPLSAAERDETSTSQDELRDVIIPFQNEYLAAYFYHEGSWEKKCCQDGEALGSADLRYGLQVKVIAMPAHPLWTGTPEGLKVGGPEFFDLDMSWTSIGMYQSLAAFLMSMVCFNFVLLQRNVAVYGLTRDILMRVPRVLIADHMVSVPSSGGNSVTLRTPP